MSYIRKIIRHNKNGETKVYYAEVESVRVDGKVIQRHIISLDTNSSFPTNFPIDNVQFSYLVVRLMQGDLTPNDVFEMLEGMGHPVMRDSLERIGINYDFGKKRFISTYFTRRTQKNPGQMPHMQKTTLHQTNRQKNS